MFAKPASGVDTATLADSLTLCPSPVCIILDLVPPHAIGKVFADAPNKEGTFDGIGQEWS
jgi:hypothetical protein